MKIPALACVLVIGAALLCRAESNTVLVISGTESNKPEGVIVGETGTNNVLMVSAAGRLITTNWSVIGFWDSAHGNAATVTGVGSSWISGLGFYIGGFGSHNRLSILSGGTAVSSNHVYMAMDAASFSNSLLVAGAGSSFLATNRTISIGENGYQNSVTVSNNGYLGARYITLGRGPDAVSNALCVGGGGRAACYNDLTCGSSGSWNRVEVSAGGDVDVNFAVLGWNASASHNVATVNMSTWSNRQDMYVGRWGSFNRLILTNGSFLYTPLQFVVGERSNSMGNEVLITESTLAVSNVLYLGMQGASNRMEIRKGGRMACLGWAYLGDASESTSNSHGNSVLVTGTNSICGIQNTLFVGRKSGWNRLEVQDGALMVNSNAYIGWGQSEFPSNGALVSGPGTIWTNSGELYISGRGNFLIISNGAKVYALHARVTEGSMDQPAFARVDGPGTEWQVLGNFHVAYYGGMSSVVLTNGGRLHSGSGTIGGSTGDSNGILMVTGAGSVWSNKGAVTVGFDGPRNRLDARRSGKVWSASGRIGGNFLAFDNTVSIEDSGSEWNCNGDFQMGESPRNQLLVEKGGRFSCSNALLGLSGVASGNVIRVAGAGSVWSNAGFLQVGAWTRADWCRVEVHTGAQMVCQSLSLGDWRQTSNHLVWVNGAGASLNAGAVSVGQTGQCNSLVVEAGGQVLSQAGVVGATSTATGNLAVVAGSGSIWSNSGALIVGESGPRNSLWMQAGAKVWAQSLCMGLNTSSVGNAILLQSGALLQVSSTTDVWRGTLALSGGTLQSPRLNLWTNAVLSGVGTVAVSSAYGYGAIEVGEPVGQLMVKGALYQQPGSSLRFDLAGHEPGAGHDQMVVTNGFGSGGTLTVARTVGFLPTLSNEFVLISWPGGHTSSGFQATNLPSWFDWQVFNSAAKTGLVLKVLAVYAATNGVPKAWLADYGWTNNFDAAATNDADGDLVPTWQEYFAGTNPTNGASYFQCLSLAPAPGLLAGKIVQWSAVSGHIYAVEASTNLPGGAWLELATNLPPIPGLWTDQVLNAVNAQYRVRARPE